eukprot:1611993-Amphidinium_carterae.2
MRADTFMLLFFQLNEGFRNSSALNLRTLSAAVQKRSPLSNPLEYAATMLDKEDLKRRRRGPLDGWTSKSFTLLFALSEAS